MRWFRSAEPAVAVRPPVAAPKPAAMTPKASVAAPASVQARVPVVEGWSENELVAVYNAAPVKHLKQGEPILTDVEASESFFVLLEGAISVTVKLNGLAGRPGIFYRGDVVAPFPKYTGFKYDAWASAPSTIIEIPPAVMKHLPDKTQLSIYKVTVDSTSKMNAYIRSVNGEMSAKNLRLSEYVAKESVPNRGSIKTDFVQGFLRSMPRMPAYATDLAAKLLDDRTSVQEVVEGIKRDPSLVAVVLKTVNSPLYGFGKKIESFYHACMILGFNNIYNLVMRGAAQSTMPVNRDTTRIHKHSCLISVLCFEIASAAKEQQSQTATTIGLLHDMGKGVQVVMKNAHPVKADLIDTFPSAILGAELLRVWGLPERICKIVECQHEPEYTSPDLISSEYHRETGILHVAHVIEQMLIGQQPEPTHTIFTQEYMKLLGLGQTTPEQLMKDRIVPSLMRNKNRIPPEIQSLFVKTPTAPAMSDE